MSNNSDWDDTSSSSWDNSGPTLYYRWHWRRPSFPFAPPVCHDQRTRLIWSTNDSWRCPVCHVPERLHDRLMLWRNSFRPERRDCFRHIFQVDRAEGHPPPRYILEIMKGYFLKVPEGMLERWRQSAKARKTNLSQMIREAVNKDIDASESSEKKGK